MLLVEIIPGRRLTSLTFLYRYFLANRPFTNLYILLTIVAVLVSCDGGSSDTNPPVITSDPQLTLGPNPDTPLAGVLHVETNERTRVRVILQNQSGTETIEFPEFSRSHSLTVLGFRPGRTSNVQTIVFDEAGNETAADTVLSVSAPSLPGDFPPIDVVSDPALMEPGYTLFDVSGSGANSGFGRAIVIVDETGEVVWYHKPLNGVSDARRLTNGNIIYINHPTVRTEITEIDMLGNIIRQWHSARTSAGNSGGVPVDTASFHHEVFEMPGGNLLVLSIEIETFDSYPSSSSDPQAPPAPANVAGDVVIEFTPDGSVVNEWSLLDMLDPFRIGYGSLGGFWNNQFPEFDGGTRDWSHGNAVIYSPSDDSIIVSLRHQDAVVKFSRETGGLIWILGPHENWDQFAFGPFLLQPVGVPFEWQYHQHASTVTPDGSILLFDNGNFRASPFDDILPAPLNFSRAVEFSVNEQNMEIAQVWEYGEFADNILYAPFLGDADYMPTTGNVLITFGGITLDSAGVPTDAVPSAKTSAQIVEVTRAETPEKVFELVVEDGNPAAPDGWTVYRAERIPDLYP